MAYKLLLIFVENYPGRSYYGGPTHECPYCGAMFWFQERIKVASSCLKAQNCLQHLLQMRKDQFNNLQNTPRTFV
jgi:hypothetical protein